LKRWPNLEGDVPQAVEERAVAVAGSTSYADFSATRLMVLKRLAETAMNWRSQIAVRLGFVQEPVISL
jgi:hypothetical protein